LFHVNYYFYYLFFFYLTTDVGQQMFRMMTLSSVLCLALLLVSALT